MKFLAYFGYIAVFLIVCGCLPKETNPQIEKINLGSLKHGNNEEPILFTFECPENEILHFVIRLKSEGLSEDEIAEIRQTWETNYSTSVQIRDSKDVLVFSENFNNAKGNISTGGNWMEPDVSFILLKSVEQSLSPGNTYEVQVSLTGNGLENYSLDLFLNRVFLPKGSVKAPG